MDVRIERELGHVQGMQVDKCRRNEILCISGLLLLVFLWFMIILSSDYKDDDVIGLSDLYPFLRKSSFFQGNFGHRSDLLNVLFLSRNRNVSRGFLNFPATPTTTF